MTSLSLLMIVMSALAQTLPSAVMSVIGLDCDVGGEPDTVMSVLAIVSIMP